MTDETPHPAEPVPSKPISSEPAAHEAEGHEPVLHEAVVQEAVVHEAGADEPVAHEPVANEPVANEPVTGEPVAHEAIVHEPIVREPIVHAAAAAPEPPAARPPVSEPPAASATRGLWVAVAVLAIVVIVGGYWLWSSIQGSDTKGLQQLQASLDDLSTRIGRLEARPIPPPPPAANLAPLQQGIAELDRKVTALENAPPPNLAPLQQGMAELATRLTALENKPPPQASLDDATRQALAALSGRIDTLTARQNELGTTEQGDIDKLSKQLTTLSGQVAAGLKSSSELAALAQQQSRTSQLQAAGAALQAGRPLGQIAGAPPALAKFATQAPPTEASLRLSFDAAAQAAHAAGQPPPGNMPLLDRMWQRAQASITVKQGDKVVVGDALSDTLEQARHLLDAGDLAGAVAALNSLTGPAADAMAPWKAQAQSLLDARAALIQTAHG